MIFRIGGYSRLAGATRIAPLARFRPLPSELIGSAISVHHGRCRVGIHLGEEAPTMIVLAVV